MKAINLVILLVASLCFLFLINFYQVSQRKKSTRFTTWSKGDFLKSTEDEAESMCMDIDPSSKPWLENNAPVEETCPSKSPCFTTFEEVRTQYSKKKSLNKEKLGNAFSFTGEGVWYLPQVGFLSEALEEKEAKIKKDLFPDLILKMKPEDEELFEDKKILVFPAYVTVYVMEITIFNWYHFTIEKTLPVLEAIMKEKTGLDETLLLIQTDRKVTTNYRQVLELLTSLPIYFFDKDQPMYFPKACFGLSHRVVEKISDKLNELRRRAWESYSPKLGTEDFAVVIRRSGTRAFVNEDEIRVVLETLGIPYQFMDTAEADFSFQVKSISRASIIIAAHGAGLTNLLWMKSNHSAIIEIFPLGFTKSFFKDISESVGFRYLTVMPTGERPYFMSEGWDSKCEVTKEECIATRNFLNHCCVVLFREQLVDVDVVELGRAIKKASLKEYRPKCTYGVVSEGQFIVYQNKKFTKPISYDFYCT